MDLEFWAGALAGMAVGFQAGLMVMARRWSRWRRNRPWHFSETQALENLAMRRATACAHPLDVRSRLPAPHSGEWCRNCGSLGPFEVQANRRER